MVEGSSDPFSELIMPFVKGTKHKILFLTKGTKVKQFLENPKWIKNAILSWTLNGVPMADRWERIAPTVNERIEAAKKVAESGFTVRIRLDPIVPIPNIINAYLDLIKSIFRSFRPERITLGVSEGYHQQLTMLKIEVGLYIYQKEVEKRLEELSSDLKWPEFELGTIVIPMGRGGAGQAREIYLRSKIESKDNYKAILHENNVQIDFPNRGFYKELFLLLLSIILEQPIMSRKFFYDSIITKYLDVIEGKITDEELLYKTKEVVQESLKFMLEMLEKAKSSKETQ
ncbi:MAG: hypothetical protein QG670_1982 [Thermoproteota archaeon]|nr:hypothetical protein [Thermoproteota archaeon]